jgi:hypothetical protein
VIRFALKDESMADKLGDYEFYVRVSADGGDSFITQDLADLKVICGVGSAKMTEPELSTPITYVVNDKTPSLGIPWFPTESKACPASKYEILSDNNPVTAHDQFSPTATSIDLLKK